VEIVRVISSRGTVRGAQLARRAGLQVMVVRRKDFDDEIAFSDALTREVDAAAPDLVLLAGFLCLWRFPARFAGRVLNIHPALLPAHGGKGMFGHHVHESVLAAGDSESGCTVHVCTADYDRGPIVLQQRVPVLPGDTVETLAARVFAAECELYPRAIEQHWQTLQRAAGA
jgi:phosphoribosylglycinamide formyltransferase-1